MPFQIIRNDITRVKADVIVNTANPRPVIGGGTDSAVYRAAGERELLAARKEIGEIRPGQAAATPAFNLSARHIIHTVGPAWVDGNHGERETLRACYANTLSLAAQLEAGSIAFPLIATGVYGFPKDEALNIALAEIGRFLLTHDMEVILVVFDQRAFELSEKLVGEIDEYIDEHAVGLAREREYGDFESARLRRRRMDSEWMTEDVTFADAAPGPEENVHAAPLSSAARPGKKESGILRRLRRREEEPENAPPQYAAAPHEQVFCGAAPQMSAAPLAEPKGRSLEEMLDATGDTFQQRLLKLIDASGMDDVTVYKKANIDRKVFSRIRCKEDYRPTKKTAVAFAIALQLDMPTMTDLLSRAEIALSPSSKFDLIIAYFVSNGEYDIYKINAALFKYGQPILGE